MLNRNFRKNLLLALSSLGALSGAISPNASAMENESKSKWESKWEKHKFDIPWIQEQSHKELKKLFDEILKKFKEGRLLNPAYIEGMCEDIRSKLGTLVYGPRGTVTNNQTTEEKNNKKQLALYATKWAIEYARFLCSPNWLYKAIIREAKDPEKLRPNPFAHFDVMDSIPNELKIFRQKEKTLLSLVPGPIKTDSDISELISKVEEYPENIKPSPGEHLGWFDSSLTQITMLSMSSLPTGPDGKACAILSKIQNYIKAKRKDPSAKTELNLDQELETINGFINDFEQNKL